METRKFPGTDISASALGMGCMRLPVTNDEHRPIDRPEAIRIIRRAIDNGVSYIDTAYGYHDGESEVVVGEALKQGYRAKVTLTTKLPVWKVEKREDMEALLDEQLKRLGVDFVDFYLAHAIDAKRYDKVAELGLREFMDEMKAKGKIRYAGFSFHDDAAAFKHILDSYDWSLAQVQMNILDTFNQATMQGVEYAGEKGVGVVVMEPLRGGSLARNVPKEVEELYAGFPVSRSSAEWAFRYLYDRKEIVTILSGMSTVEQLDDNIRIFAQAKVGAMTLEEQKLITSVREAYEARVRVGCTGCEYCQPCPQGVPIPHLFRRYDASAMFSSFDEFFSHYRRDPALQKCVECGACESACPQHIEIRNWIKRIDAEAMA